MKNTYDVPLLIAVCIIILFAIFILIYTFNNNDINNLSQNDAVINNVYTEHTHKQNSQDNNITKIQTEYTDIASYTTKIQDKDANRVYNIKLACKRLDGHIVSPDNEFSFNNTMGNMGKEDGFKKSTGFDSNGNKIKVYGGGMCQISSTLYNAVLIAKLQITERHAHSRRVYYVPKNKDATVFSGGPDFKFINNTDSNIMICTSTDGYTVTITLKQETIIAPPQT